MSYRKKKKGQGLMEAVLCLTTEFGGRGQDLFREVMHMRGSKAKCDGKEHSVLGKKKRKKENVTEIAWPAQLQGQNLPNHGMRTVTKKGNAIFLHKKLTW